MQTLTGDITCAGTRLRLVTSCPQRSSQKVNKVCCEKEVQMAAWSSQRGERASAKNGRRSGRKAWHNDLALLFLPPSSFLPPARILLFTVILRTQLYYFSHSSSPCSAADNTTPRRCAPNISPDAIIMEGYNCVWWLQRHHVRGQLCRQPPTPPSLSHQHY